VKEWNADDSDDYDLPDGIELKMTGSTGSAG
jgi:hypothetical protein